MGTRAVAAFTWPLAITSTWDDKEGQLPGLLCDSPCLHQGGLSPSWAGPGRAGEGRTPPTAQGWTTAGLRSNFSWQQTCPQCKTVLPAHTLPDQAGTVHRRPGSPQLS